MVSDMASFENSDILSRKAPQLTSFILSFFTKTYTNIIQIHHYTNIDSYFSCTRPVYLLNGYPPLVPLVIEFAFDKIITLLPESGDIFFPFPAEGKFGLPTEWGGLSFLG